MDNLTPEVEKRLHTQSQAGSVEATNEIILAHLPLIEKTVAAHSTVQNYDDHYQDAVMGLMTNIPKFKLKEGTCIGSYICRYVTHHIYSMYGSEQGIRLPRKVMREVHKVEAYITAHPSINVEMISKSEIAEIADALDITEGEVLDDLKILRSFVYRTSLEGSLDAGLDAKDVTFSTEDKAINAIFMFKLREVFSELSEEEQNIIVDLIENQAPLREVVRNSSLSKYKIKKEFETILDIVNEAIAEDIRNNSR